MVLVGGGHSHVQVLRRHRERPFAARLTIVLDHPESVYSGMVPGFVAGQYSAGELVIDVWALARTAGARVVDGAAVRIDASAGQLEVEDHAPIAWDTLSVDIGATVAGLDLPGVREFALSTRPIAQFIGRVNERLDEAHGVWPEVPGGEGAPATIVVVGGGAAGFELAYCLNARTGRAVELVGATVGTLPVVANRAVRLREGRVHAVTARGVVLDTGEELAAALVVWATGAAALPLATRSDLPTVDGYLKVGPTLQVEGHPGIFAVGDCACVVDARGRAVPKAGVYAVREGPVLCANLDARLSGTQCQPYRPQRAFFSLLNLGDGRAIGRRGGLTVRGAWVWRLKDRIDRKFMAMFQVIGPDDRPRTMVGAAVMDPDMQCGGCAAKVGPAELHRALAHLPAAPPDPSVEVGLVHADDAALVRLPGGDRLGLTVDAFTAFCDDPFLVGRVAAVNAVNDLYVKGVTPRWALALVSVPDEAGLLDELLAGVRRGLDDLGVSLVGGHSVRADVLSVGLSVTGIAEAVDDPAVLPGHLLLLTGGIGSGVLLRGNAFGRARGVWVREVNRWMSRSHRDATGVLRAHAASAMTDVTGFGLYGHLSSLLARAGGLGAEVRVADVPLYPGVGSLYAQGVRSTFHHQNARGVAVDGPGLSHPLAGLGFDPQTAGPLLFTIAPERAQAVIAALSERGEPASVIGIVTPGPGVRLV